MLFQQNCQVCAALKKGQSKSKSFDALFGMHTCNPNYLITTLAHRMESTSLTMVPVTPDTTSVQHASKDMADVICGNRVFILMILMRRCLRSLERVLSLRGGNKSQARTTWSKTHKSFAAVRREQFASSSPILCLLGHTSVELCLTNHSTAQVRESPPVSTTILQ